MKKLNIKEIWKFSVEREISNKVLTPEDIRAYRSKRLRKIKSRICFVGSREEAVKSLKA